MTADTPQPGSEPTPERAATAVAAKRRPRGKWVKCEDLKAGDFIKYPGKGHYVRVESVELRPGVAEVATESRKQPFLFGRIAQIMARVAEVK